MDESLQELENELKALAPRRPSPGMSARIDAALSAPESAAPVAPAPARPLAPVLRFPGWAWTAVAAGVACAALLVLRQPASVLLSPPAAVVVAADSRTTPPPPAARTWVADETYRPVAATNVLYAAQEETPAPDADAGARQVRYRYVDTYTYRNPATKASLRWSVPRDEVRVIPASFH